MKQERNLLREARRRGFQSPRNRVNTSNDMRMGVSRGWSISFNPLEIGSTLQMGLPLRFQPLHQHGVSIP